MSSRGGTLDQLLLDLRRLTENKNYTEVVKRLQESNELLSSQTLTALDSFLSALDARQHTLCVAVALSTKLASKENVHIGQLLDQLRIFVAEFDVDQVKAWPSAFCQLFHAFTSYISAKQCPMQAVSILKTAISRYQRSPHHLTSIHADLIQVCLESKCLKVALPFLDEDIHEFMTENNQFEVKYLLLYYYYGGIVYAALRQYDRSLFCFIACLTTPSLAVSAITIEAFKKFILVSLLKSGRVVSLPRYAPNVVSRLIQPVCVSYTDIAAAYKTHNADELEKVITRHQQHYQRDLNLGLVTRVRESLYKRNIQQLTESFLTLSLDNVASHIRLSGGAKEAEKYIRTMIENGEIHATIDQVNGMVAFRDNPEKFCTDDMALHINQQMSQCIAMEEKITQFDYEILLDEIYIRRSLASHSEDDPLLEDEALM